MAQNQLDVVIPVKNEATTLPKLIQELHGINTIVVDGGSDDGTQRVARESGASVVMGPISGYGRAYKVGIECSNSEYVAGMDGDGTYPAADIRKALALAEETGAHAVFGNRLVSRKGWRPYRYLANLAITFFINMLFWKNIPDSQSGFWLIQREAAIACLPNSNGMPFSQEIKLRLMHSGYKCLWMTIPYKDRGEGSKFNLARDGISLVLNAINLKLAGLKTKGKA